jgi:hypothetical protein
MIVQIRTSLWHDVFEVVKKENLSSNAAVLSNEKEGKWSYHARLNARGYESKLKVNITMETVLQLQL